MFEDYSRRFSGNRTQQNVIYTYNTPHEQFVQKKTQEKHLKSEVGLGGLRELHAVAELSHEPAAYPGAPRHVQAGQRRAVHGDAGHAGLRDRRATGEVEEVRVHAAEGPEGRVVDPLAAPDIELGEVLQAPREGG